MGGYARRPTPDHKLGRQQPAWRCLHQWDMYMKTGDCKKEERLL